MSTNGIIARATGVGTFEGRGEKSGYLSGIAHLPLGE